MCRPNCVICTPTTPPCFHFASRLSPWHVPLPTRGTTRRVLALRAKKHIFALAKEEGLGLFLFSHIRGLTILYEREKLSYRIVKIISNPVIICSFIIFPMCFIVNISFFFAEIFKERILLSLIIPKLSHRPALTIANAPSTLCAESEKALTSFISPLPI